MENESAAQVDDSNLDVGLDQPEIETNPEAQQAESAPADTEDENAQDVIQKRINKEVGKTYKEKRRADAAEAELQQLRAEKPVTVSKAPTLEEFDHDEEKFNTASIKHQVAEAVKAERQLLNTEAQQATAAQAGQTYDKLVADFGKEDFHEVAGGIPVLDQSLVQELMRTKEGVEMIYHLGSHLDLASDIAGMSPLQAMGELGRISSTMSTKQDVKLSAAPEPIEPLNSGGSISADRGPVGATFE